MSHMRASLENEQPRTHGALKSFKDYWQWPYLFDILLAASLSLFVFGRFLDFFITPTVNKVFVIISLFAFFFLLSLFFITPILKRLKNQSKALIAILLISLVITGAFWILLPEQKMVIRTVHKLKISIAPESGSVILENFLGPTNDAIPWEEITFDGAIEDAALVLPPGGVLDYSREMTGGVSFTLTALEEDAKVIIGWDGVESIVSLPDGEPIEWATDPTSVGAPSKVNQILFSSIKINEWLGAFLILVVLLGTVSIFFDRGKFRYKICCRDTQRYLLTYLILGTVLLLVAIGVRAYRPATHTQNMIILMPGLIYLMIKLIYRVWPPLPLLLFVLTLVVNLFAYRAWFDPDPLRVRDVVDQTFNELVILVNPSDINVMSVGFYRQLRGSELILPTGTFLAEEDSVARLNRINYHKNIVVLDYPNELSVEDYNRLMTMDGWTTWHMRHDGSFYFYQADRAITSPIVVFTYLDDFLLIPEDQLNDLGLFNDFIFD